jgi:hypothetical protein
MLAGLKTVVSSALALFHPEALGTVQLRVSLAQLELPSSGWWQWALVIVGAGILGGALMTGGAEERATTLPRRSRRRLRFRTGDDVGVTESYGRQETGEWTSVRTGRTVPIPAGMIEDETVRYYAPPLGTLKILGPWFNVETPTSQAIRLFSLPNAGGETEITFGRKPGPPYSHIQIKRATVSGHQATVRLFQRRAELINFSKTNPTKVNGNPVLSGSLELQDGDAIDLGGVVMRFHARPPAECTTGRSSSTGTSGS